MTDLDRAYEILGLKPGAAPEEVEAAYRDLKAVWSPDRFLVDRRLQRKAKEKLALIDEAYRQIERAWQYGQGEPAQVAGAGAKRPSLYDDTLSGRTRRGKFPIPLWALVLSVFLLVSLALYFAGHMGSGPQIETPAVTSEPVPMPTPVIEQASPTAVAPAGGEQTRIPPQAETDRSSAGTSSAARENGEAAVQARKQTRPPVDVAAAEPPRRQRSESEKPRLQTGAPPRPTPETPKPVEPEPAPEPVLSEQATKAFELLKDKSDAALRLVEGLTRDLVYREWKPVREEGNEVWIDIVANVAEDGRELHLIWLVNTKTEIVKPLSQAARDLEGRIAL